MEFTLVTFALLFLMIKIHESEAPPVFPIATLIVYAAYLIRLWIAL